MKKLLIFLIVSLLLVSSVLAQNETPAPGAEELLEKTGELERIVGEGDWDYLGERWRALFLTSSVINSIDEFLQDIDIVFVVLMARHYSLSLEFFLAVILWVFILLSVESYSTMFPFVKEGWQRVIFSFAGATIIAQTRVLNLIILGITKILFYKKNFWWVFAAVAVSIVFFFVFLKFNKYISAYLEATRKKKAEKALEARVGETEAFVEGVRKGRKILKS